MKGLAGWKLWVFVGVSVALAAGVFLLQSGPPAQPETVSEPVIGESDEGDESGGADMAPDAFTAPFLVGEEALAPPAEAAGEAPEIEAEIGEAVVGALHGSEEPEGEPLPVEAETEAVGPGVTAAGEVGEAALSGVAAEGTEPGAAAPGEAVEGTAVAEAVGEFVPLPVQVAEVENTGVVEAWEPMPASGDGGDSKGAGRRVEFELDADAPAAAIVEKAVNGERAAAESAETAGRALAVRLRVPQARGGDRVLRGSFGYRVPLVVRQAVPDRIIGGVYVPAHEMYVIARQGQWEVEEAGGDMTGMRPAPAGAAGDTAGEPAESWFLLPWLLDKLKGPRRDGGQE